MNEVNNLIYYFAGIISGVLLVFLVSKEKLKPKISKAHKTWQKIENFEYSLDVDHTLKSPATIQQLAFIMAEVMKLKIEKEPGLFKEITVKPGAYSIHVNTRARFILREELKPKEEK